MSKVSNEILKTEKRVNDLEGRRSAAAADLQKTLGRIVELRDQRKLAMVDGLNTAALDQEIRKTEEDSERKTDLVDGLIDAIASSEAALADLRAQLARELSAGAVEKFRSAAILPCGNTDCPANWINSGCTSSRYRQCSARQ